MKNTSTSTRIYHGANGKVIKLVMTISGGKMNLKTFSQKNETLLNSSRKQIEKQLLK